MRRWEWLAGLVRKYRWTTGAEIGVKEGRTTFFLLDSNPRLKMLAVDCWQPVPESGADGYKGWPHGRHERSFRKRAAEYAGRISIIFRGFSVNAALIVPDRSLDFVFIDADHSRKAVIADILAWLPKIQPGGMISGHDAGRPSVLAALAAVLPRHRLAGHDNCWFWQAS